MTNEKRGYYCDYCGLELQWFQVTHDERCVRCGNRVGGEYAGSDHAKVIALQAQAALDAKVTEAAREHRQASKTVEEGSDPDDAGFSLGAAIDWKYETAEALDAALAARDKEA